MSKIFYIMGKSSSGKNKRKTAAVKAYYSLYDPTNQGRGDRWCGIFFCGRRKAERA